MDGCATCTNTSVCLSCMRGIVLFNGNCFNNSNCLALSSPNECTLCPDGKFLLNHQCYQCEPSCKTCSSYDKCDTCNSTYSIVKNRYCDQCKQIFNLCDTCTSIKCLSCSRNSYLKADGTCELCSALFPNCQRCTPAACVACNNLYYLSGTLCTVGTTPFCATGVVGICTTCIENAQLVDVTGIKYCYLDACLQYFPSSPLCDICKPGYSRDVNGQCQKETSTDSDCLYWYMDKCIEYQFYMGFFNATVNYYCNISYPFACDFCDKYRCLECGFIYMMDAAYTCPERTISSCLIEVAGKCYECTYTGHYVSQNRLTCIGPPGFITIYCQKFNIMGQCVLCNYGYMISGNECILKADECVLYDNFGKCEECVFSSITDGVCSTSVTDNCDFMSGLSCLDCFYDSHYDTNGACTLNINNCIDYDLSTGYCARCVRGYTIDGSGNCLKCTIYTRSDVSCYECVDLASTSYVMLSNGTCKRIILN